MSRLALGMVFDLLHAAARMQSRIAAALAVCFIYPSQLYDNLCYLPNRPAKRFSVARTLVSG